MPTNNYNCHIPGKPWQITGGWSNFQIKTMSRDINTESEQTTRNSPKFYFPKVSDEKFIKVFLHWKFVLYGTSYRTCLTNHMGSISCQITPLVINSLGWTHIHTHACTHTHVRTHAHAHTHTHTHTHRLTGQRQF